VRVPSGRALAAAVAALLVLGAAAWVWQEALLLAALGWMADRRLPVGPPRPVAWESGPDPGGRTAGARPPNVVLILADDLGWNDVSVAGGGVAGGRVATPHIDSIARDGVRFSSGYAAHGTCAPSRAALLTGRYATRFGFEFTPTPAGMNRLVPRIAAGMPGRLRHSIVHEAAGSAPAYEDLGMPPSEITLAELLRDAGYHTVHIGKWHLGRSGGMAPHEQGFDESLLMASGLYLPADHPEVVNAPLTFDPIDRFLWHAMNFAASFGGGDAFEPAGYLTDYYTDEAVRVIEANRERPFFLYLAHWAPHTPLQARRDDYAALEGVEPHRLRVYGAMVRALDRGVGRVLEALRANGLEENTLVVFTSDNGAAGYLGLPDVNRPLRGWKITFFEGGIRVPFFMKWPRALRGGQTYYEPVHGADVFATAAAAAGAALPDDRPIDGVDLLPYVRGERPGFPHDALFWRSGHYRVVRSSDWKLQRNERAPESPWLFDLRADPGETLNRASAEPGRVAALTALLDAHDAEQAPPAWPSTVELPVNVDKTLAEPDAEDDAYLYWPN